MSVFTYNEAVAMDKILQLCLTERNKQFGPNAIKNETLKEFDRNEIIDLLKKIHTFHLKIANVNPIRDGENVMANENTNSFLKEGGFKEYYNKHKQEK